MLTDVVKQTRDEIDQYVQLQTQIKQLEHIKNTKAELDTLRRRCTKIGVAFELLHPHLDDMQCVSVEGNIEAINTRLRASYSEFQKGNYEQARMLGQISVSVKSLDDNLGRSWLIYAQDQIRPYQELMRIAKTLPQMEQSISQIETLIAELSSATKNLPTLQSWSNFHTKLKQVEKLLEDIQGLSQEKRDFLQSIREGKATLSNITPHLLEWCDQIGLSEVLVLRFDNES